MRRAVTKFIAFSVATGMCLYWYDVFDAETIITLSLVLALLSLLLDEMISDMLHCVTDDDAGKNTSESDDAQ